MARLHTTQVKHSGWYPLPIARTIWFRIKVWHRAHFSKVFCRGRRKQSRNRIDKEGDAIFRVLVHGNMLSAYSPDLMEALKSFAHSVSGHQTLNYQARESYVVAGFAYWPPFFLVVTLPCKGLMACPAHETIGMILFVHSFDDRSPTGDVLVAKSTDIWKKE